MQIPFAACLLTIVPLHASAWDYGGAAGENGLGQTVGIHGSYSELPDLTIVVSPTHPATGPSRMFSFAKECSIEPPHDPESGALGSYIRCRKDGESPLAGVTYKIVANKGACAGWSYFCVMGCGRKQVPNVMHESPWEC